MDNTLEHIPSMADLKPYVKDRVYHIQHVNSLHNRLKKWLNERILGVPTKHLQPYMNWFRMNEFLKGTAQPMSDLANRTILDINARARYFETEAKYK